MNSIEAIGAFRKYRTASILTNIGIVCALTLCVCGIILFNSKSAPLTYYLIVTLATLLTGGAAAAFIYSEIMQRKIKMFCDNCEKFIDHLMAWKCGYCDTENDSTVRFSFLNKCKCCGRSPHAFMCPHCEKLIYFDGQHFASNHAKSATATPPPVVSPDADHAREVKEIERKREITRLNAELVKEEAELERVRQLKDDSTKKPLGEKLEESFSAFRDRNIAIGVIAKRELARAETEYVNDPDLLERYRLTVEAWREDNMQ